MPLNRRAACAAIFIVSLWALLPGFAFAQEGAPAEGAGTGEAPADTGSVEDGAAEGAAIPGRDVAAPLESTAIQALQAYHRIGPNDYLRIRLTAGETLSYDRRVGGDGTVSLPLLGNVSALGLTVSSLETELELQYSRYYVNPEVIVDLVELGQLQVLILREDGPSEVRAVRNGTTLVDVLRGALGSSLLYRRVVLIRGGEALFNSVRESTVPGMPGFDPTALMLPEAEVEQITVEPGGSGTISAPISGTSQQMNGTLEVSSSYSVRNRERIGELTAREGVVVQQIDTAELLRGGPLGAGNLRLQHGDIIYLTNSTSLPVQPAQPETRLVRITGVPVSGLYALLPGETLADLLRLSGFIELPHLDLRNVLIESRDAAGQLRRIVLNLEQAGPNLERLATVELEHRDTVKILPYLSQVFVMGDVNVPGAYAHNDLYLAQDYLAVAGGAAPTANLHEVYIVRPQRDLGTGTQQPLSFTVDLIHKVRGEAQEGYSILPGDVIFVAHKSRRFQLGDVTSALNTIFLGLNYFDRLNDDTTPVNENPNLPSGAR